MDPPFANNGNTRTLQDLHASPQPIMIWADSESASILYLHLAGSTDVHLDSGCVSSELQAFIAYNSTFSYI
jgi:hypothetical protein